MTLPSLATTPIKQTTTCQLEEGTYLAALSAAARAVGNRLTFGQAPSPAPLPKQVSWVQRNGTRLQVDGQAFHVVGANRYLLMREAADPAQREAALTVMRAAQDLGINVLRVWAFADGLIRPSALQPLPGQFNEQVFSEGLDYIISQAANFGLRLVLTFTNSFNDSSGGMQEYVSHWFNATGATSITDFYANPLIRTAFKAYVRQILMRRNSITGVNYRDEPSILAWDLAHQAQCPGDDTGDILQEWLQDMATFVKSLDPAHLLTVGLRGYFGAQSAALQDANPYDINAYALGGSLLEGGQVDCSTDISQHSSVPIDLTALEGTAAYWQLCSPACKANITQRWIRTHLQEAAVLDKPLLITQFAKSRPVKDRDALFEMVYSTIYKAALEGLPAAGSLMWQLAPETATDPDGYSVYLSPPTNPINNTWAEPLPQPCQCTGDHERDQRFRNWDLLMQCAVRHTLLPYVGDVDVMNDGWNVTIGLINNNAAEIQALSN
ncbi:hypothetical protein WJX72_002615 [[Myrmecia] bisecta]|uniref:mannan endo-1,4-beta-mannosidase n=1 Tax=[Myrmecia] bisecta TaxID=41462 RepID=A0AAW1QPN0_9CHLO